jgi:hypothetical protein
MSVGQFKQSVIYHVSLFSFDSVWLCILAFIINRSPRKETMKLSIEQTWMCRHPMQGCQMVCFQTKNPNFGKFWMALEWKTIVYFMVIWNILRSFGIFYGHLVML